MILLIDNYDSFVHNLARYVRLLGFETEVVRNDAITIDQIVQLNPEAILISPGPCTPGEAGNSVEIVKQLGDRFPILGICLGHQAIVQAFGGTIIRSDQPMHGRTSPITHQQRGVFQGVPTPLQAGRYHSLIADRGTLPACLKITAETSEGTIMAVEHNSLDIVGLQFHPESILTDSGSRILANFFRHAKV